VLLATGLHGERVLSNVAVALKLVLVQSSLMIIVAVLLVLTLQKKFLVILNVVKCLVLLVNGLTGDRVPLIVVVAQKLVLVKSQPKLLVVVALVLILPKQALAILNVAK
jgi:hypothetical protein